MQTALFLMIFLIFSPLLKLQETDKKWQDQLGKYADILYLIQDNYPLEFNKKKLVFNSIKGLLKSLDPHSCFFDPIALRSISEEYEGKYYGIGTKIVKYEDRLTIIAPIKGTPADRLGLMAGDVIIKIDENETSSINVDEAMNLLRGSEGSSVKLTIQRPGMPAPLKFQIQRAEIPLNTVSRGVTLPGNPHIGYISIKSFGMTTDTEFHTAVSRLVKEEAINSLIIDLRENPGGSLYAALKISDFFLKKGKIILTTKSRRSSETFYSKKENLFGHLKTAVLINRGSASASEILASALQDHKRATILGTRSWGKGLVETVSSVSMNCAIALTTAKYYTPAGKCLQRNYEVLDDYYFFFNNHKYDTDHSVSGGVIPDVMVKSDYYPSEIAKLISKGAFFSFAKQLTSDNPDIKRDFKVNRKTLNLFYTFLEKQKIPFKREKLKKHKKRLSYEILWDLYNLKFSDTHKTKLFLANDPVTRRAVIELKKSI